MLLRVRVGDKEIFGASTERKKQKRRIEKREEGERERESAFSHVIA